MSKIPKSEITLPANLFSLILKMSKSKPWLTAKDDNLASIFSLCKNDGEKQLIYNLIDRFEYITDSDFNNYIDNILKNFSDQFKRTNSSVIFAPLYNDDHDKRSDSSLMVLHRLKARNLSKLSFPYIDINSAFKAIHEPNITDVVLVDEFIGSGKQALDIIKALKKKITTHALPVKLHVGTIACMNKTSAKISHSVESFYSAISLKRGISDYHDFHTSKKLKKTMEEIESNFTTDVKMGRQIKKFYHLGFNQSQTLYKYENGTTPNNVFPVLYWRHLRDGSYFENLIEPH